METVSEQVQIEQWLAEAEAAEEPGQSLKQRVIHRGNDDLETPMRVHSLESAGYTKVYHTVTGDMSLCNNNMLPMQLRKKLPDGRLAFSTKPPEGITPFVGTTKCMLHPDDENRDKYDELGFAVCRKSNLANPHQMVRHMQHRHKIEWAAIQEMKEDQRREEDRAFQRQMYSALAVNAVEYPVDSVGTEEAPLYISDKPKVEKRPRLRKPKK